MRNGSGEVNAEGGRNEETAPDFVCSFNFIVHVLETLHPLHYILGASKAK
jgi:hypothetical protein